MLNVEESMGFETILSLTGEDYRKAYEIYTILRKETDVSYPLPSYASVLSKMIGKREEDVDYLWRSIRDSYQRIRGSFEIIDDRNPLFPKEILESEYPTPFLYALGNLRLLEKENLAVIGSLSPDEESALIAMEASRFINSNKLVLLTPLRLGISSIMIADTIKDSGNVIAFSSSFVTKAPNERLKNQMVDIYKRGGLIISATGPSRKEDKWHQVIRNRAISALSDAVLLIEEKDGGPSWRIFDGAGDSVRKMVSSRKAGRPGYSFITERIANGALEYRDERDLKKLLSKKKSQGCIKTDLSLTPDLF